MGGLIISLPQRVQQLLVEPCGEIHAHVLRSLSKRAYRRHLYSAARMSDSHRLHADPYSVLLSPGQSGVFAHAAAQQRTFRLGAGTMPASRRGDGKCGEEWTNLGPLHHPA